MTITEIEINDKTLPCHIHYKHIRHAYIRIKPDLQLDISLPHNRSITAESILKEKHRWLEKKVRELSLVRRIFKDGTMLFKGEYVKVEMRMAEQSESGVQFGKKSVVVYGNQEQKNGRVLNDFIASQTLAHVKLKAAEFARELGVTCDSIATRETRSWGYCTRQGKLFFNWRLICLPPRLADFIVYHELVHLKHFNHSKRFKNALARHFTDCKELESQLKTYSAH
jgi:predicted metal-dependent hydrolase